MNTSCVSILYTCPSLVQNGCPIATQSRCINDWNPVSVRKYGSINICVRLAITQHISLPSPSEKHKVIWICNNLHTSIQTNMKIRHLNIPTNIFYCSLSISYSISSVQIYLFLSYPLNFPYSFHSSQYELLSYYFFFFFTMF